MAPSELMADPYASGGGSKPAESAPLPSAPALGGGWAATEQLNLNGGAPQPDYLFPESYDESFRRSWGERLTYHVGGAYLVGLVAGGGYGFWTGMRDSAGEMRKIRVNSVLNSMGKMGPGWGNSLGCIAMMCTIFESIAYNVRGTDDLLNPAGAAALTGGIYKITAGPRVAGMTAVGLAAVTTVGTFITKQLSSRPGALKFF